MVVTVGKNSLFGGGRYLRFGSIVNSIVLILGFGLAHTWRRPIRRLVRGRISPVPSPVYGSSSEIDVAKVQGRVQGGRRLGLQQRRHLCSGTALYQPLNLVFPNLFLFTEPLFD